MLKENLEKITSICNENIIYILKSNQEQITENNNGYFFDLTKLKPETITDLENLVEKKLNEEVHVNTALSFCNSNSGRTKDIDSTADPKNSGQSQSLQSQPQSIVKRLEVNGTNVTPSQKFISEYTLDLNKTNEKTSTLLKFMNSRKKYIRNPETLLSKNESQLVKNEYVM